MLLCLRKYIAQKGLRYLPNSAPFDSNMVYRYNAINGEGTEFPNSLYQNSAVVTIGGRVVLIGGVSEGHVTNKVLTLHYSGEWVEEYTLL